MQQHAFICTKSTTDTPTKRNLLKYLESGGFKIKLMVDQESIFSGYVKAMEFTNPDDEDLILLCHDDIEIITPSFFMLSIINEFINNGNTGFMGVAGTSWLTKSGVWWDKSLLEQGFHRGKVRHGPSVPQSALSVYGPPNKLYGEVAVIDGLFMAAQAKVIREVGLEKPEYFTGLWDFYDLHYSSEAHKLGYNNYVIPVDVLHNSPGVLVGRDSWHANREAFIQNNDFPIKVRVK